MYGSPATGSLLRYQRVCWTALSRSARVFSAPLASLWTVLRIMRWSWVARQTAAAPTAMPTAVPAIVENCITMPPFRVLVPSMPRVGAAMQQNEAEKSGKKAGSPNSAFFYAAVYGRIAVLKKEQTRTNKRNLTMSNAPKTVLAIHDLPGFGRAALSVIVPVLSCLGVQAK